MNHTIFASAVASLADGSSCATWPDLLSPSVREDKGWIQPLGLVAFTTGPQPQTQPRSKAAAPVFTGRRLTPRDRKPDAIRHHTDAP
jgi:hypothetical protein